MKDTQSSASDRFVWNLDRDVEFTGKPDERKSMVKTAPDEQGKPDDLDDSETLIYAVILAILQKYQDLVINAILAGDTASFDSDAFKQDLRAALYPKLLEVAQDEIARLAGELGIDVDEAEVATDAAIMVSEHLDELVPGLADTTAKLIDQTQKQIPELEQSGSKITRAILAGMLVGAFGPGRAGTVAITGNTQGRGIGATAYNKQLKGLGIQSERVWVTAHDERVCPVCSPLNGQPESAWQGMYPLGPPTHPRCRCYLAVRIIQPAKS